MIEITYKLYHDSFGKVLFYSCEEHEGDFLIIDAMTYAEGRFDIQVVDGKIQQLESVSTIFKLVIDDKGTKCPIEDISIIANETYTGKINFWNVKNV